MAADPGAKDACAGSDAGTHAIGSVNGTGSLTVTSPAGHGIVSKDELTVTGGTYTITIGESSGTFNAN